VIIRGYGIVWDDEAALPDRRETFAPNAFTRPISCSLRCSHDSRTYAGYAYIRPVQDEHGLRFEAVLDINDRRHRQLIAAVRGGMTGVSIGFRALASEWPAGDLERITKARLTEISITGADAAAYSAGGCWVAGDEDLLLRKLSALGEHYRTAAPLLARQSRHDSAAPVQAIRAPACAPRPLMSAPPAFAAAVSSWSPITAWRNAYSAAAAATHDPVRAAWCQHMLGLLSRAPR
jgi:HK97 family phage prohead protease